VLKVAVYFRVASIVMAGGAEYCLRIGTHPSDACCPDNWRSTFQLDRPMLPISAIRRAQSWMFAAQTLMSIFHLRWPVALTAVSRNVRCGYDDAAKISWHHYRQRRWRCRRRINVSKTGIGGGEHSSDEVYLSSRRGSFG
jgi:hypothetical protein